MGLVLPNGLGKRISRLLNFEGLRIEQMGDGSGSLDTIAHW
jgi:hypothetical protein